VFSLFISSFFLYFIYLALRGRREHTGHTQGMLNQIK
jgi:hypothetical protein